MDVDWQNWIPAGPTGPTGSQFLTSGDFDQKMGSEPRVAQVLFSWLTDSFSILAVPASRSFKPEQAAKHSQALWKYVKDTRISRGKEQGNQSILFLPAGWFQNLSVAVIISGMVIKYLDFLHFFLLRKPKKSVTPNKREKRWYKFKPIFQ